MSYTKILLVC